MKKIAMALAFAAASLLSTTASAQAYASGHLGFSNIDIDCANTGASCDKSNAAFKLLGGYGFGNGLAVELGYTSYGHATVSGLGGSAKVKLDAFQVGGAYHAPLGAGFGLTARLGLASAKVKVSAFGVSDSESNTQPYFGFAGTYAVAKNIKLEAGLDFTRGEIDGEKIDARALTVGARFQF